MHMTILGSGTSHGVPMIGCHCNVCTSTDPRNRRLRPSACVTNGSETILIDATPELRLQALAVGLDRVDAVLVTHTHADHIMGLDDIRRFNDLAGRSLPIYGSQESLDDIHRIFRYAFMETQIGGGNPRLDLELLDSPARVCGMNVTPIPVLHGALPILAYRIDDIAYVTDVNYIPPAGMAMLRGLRLLVLDAVRPLAHSTHFGLEQAVPIAAALGAERTLFTHLSHAYDHAKTNAILPAGMELAYDGQVIDLD
jgi:phosphoribosyl 1,2-cyclic phosphate phosphodiesterase